MSLRMESSIWTATLASFRDRVAGPEPAPAGVSAAAVTATFGLGLVIKALEIAGKRSDFAGDPQRLGALLDAARSESASLTQDADLDIAAFRHYMDAVRLPNTTKEQQDRRRRAMDAAMQKAIEVPLRAARSAVAGLGLCIEAAGMVHALLAADLGAAAALLSGAAQAMLLSVDFNVRQLSSDEKYYQQVSKERRELEDQALRHAETVLSRVGRIPGPP